jgi:hypothetical protein
MQPETGVDYWALVPSRVQERTLGSLPASNIYAALVTASGVMVPAMHRPQAPATPGYYLADARVMDVASTSTGNILIQQTQIDMMTGAIAQTIEMGFPVANEAWAGAILPATYSKLLALPDAPPPDLFVAVAVFAVDANGQFYLDQASSLNVTSYTVEGDYPDVYVNFTLNKRPSLMFASRSCQTPTSAQYMSPQVSLNSIDETSTTWLANMSTLDGSMRAAPFCVYFMGSM